MGSRFEMTDASLWIVLSTIGSIEQAQVIAKTLVTEKKVACVNILPAVQSIYCWKEELCHEAECLMIFKLLSAQYAEFERRLKELHPYETPEIVALPAARVFEGYLEWVIDSHKVR